jgi:hypothetical protein
MSSNKQTTKAVPLLAEDDDLFNEVPSIPDSSQKAVSNAPVTLTNAKVTADDDDDDDTENSSGEEEEEDDDGKSGSEDDDDDDEDEEEDDEDEEEETQAAKTTKKKKAETKKPSATRESSDKQRMKVAQSQGYIQTDSSSRKASKDSEDASHKDLLLVSTRVDPSHFVFADSYKEGKNAFKIMALPSGFATKAEKMLLSDKYVIVAAHAETRIVAALVLNNSRTCIYAVHPDCACYSMLMNMEKKGSKDLLPDKRMASFSSLGIKSVPRRAEVATEEYMRRCHLFDILKEAKSKHTVSGGTIRDRDGTVVEYLVSTKEKKEAGANPSPSKTASSKESKKRKRQDEEDHHDEEQEEGAQEESDERPPAKKQKTQDPLASVKSKADSYGSDKKNNKKKNNKKSANLSNGQTAPKSANQKEDEEQKSTPAPQAHQRTLTLNEAIEQSMGVLKDGNKYTIEEHVAMRFPWLSKVDKKRMSHPEFEKMLSSSTVGQHIIWMIYDSIFGQTHGRK